MNFNIIVLLLFILCISFNCTGSHRTVETESPAVSQNTPGSEQAFEEPATLKSAIPPDCPLARIKEGMGRGQVMDILGPPKDQEIYTTGKQWIPFYFGSDVVRTVFYYKGLGQIHFNRGRVIGIMYDPTEDGYR